MILWLQLVVCSPGTCTSRVGNYPDELTSFPMARESGFSGRTWRPHWGKLGGHQFLCALLKDQGCRAQGPALSHTHAGIICLEPGGAMWIRCWRPGPGLGLDWPPLQVCYRGATILTVRLRISGKDKFCDSIIKCKKSDQEDNGKANMGSIFWLSHSWA